MLITKGCLRTELAFSSRSVYFRVDRKVADVQPHFPLGELWPSCPLTPARPAPTWIGRSKGPQLTPMIPNRLGLSEQYKLTRGQRRVQNKPFPVMLPHRRENT